MLLLSPLLVLLPPLPPLPPLVPPPLLAAGQQQ
jgi:hypothetical protein